MDNTHRYHIYVLLCAVILADKRIRDVEIETFISLVSGFQVALDDPQPQTDDEIRHWFEDNNGGVSNWLHQDNWRQNIENHLKALSGFDYKWQLLQAMRSIAISDKEFHKSEVAILRLAIDYWNEDFDLIL